MTSFLSLQVTLQQQNSINNLLENYDPETLYFQLSCQIILQHEMNILRQHQHAQQQKENNNNNESDAASDEDALELELRELVNKPPKGFTKFHRLGPLSLFSPSTSSSINNNNKSVSNSLTCALPMLHDKTKDLARHSDDNGDDRASLENLLLKIELVQIIKQEETGKVEENLLGQAVMTWRQFPSSFLSNNNSNKPFSIDLPPIEMNFGSKNNTNNGAEQQATEEKDDYLLQLRLRDVSTLFESPLACINDPGPPRLRFIGNLPQIRKIRRNLRKLYGFSHLASVAYHALQYVLQMTNTSNESGNIVFGPKRLVALEQAIARGWGGRQPLFRFSLMRRLDVSNTFFGDIGFSVILSVVHFGQRIEELNISKCGFTGRSVPAIVQTLLSHDGIEALDISCNDLMEVSGEDLLRLPRNNARITAIDAGGNAFSNYVVSRLAKYCNENLDTFNQDPLNPFGMSCGYLRGADDVSGENWSRVHEVWLALTAMYASGSNKNKPEEHGELLMVIKDWNAQEQETEIDSEGNHRIRNGIHVQDDNSEQQEEEFLIPPVATAPLLSLVWWRAFEQIINKIDDPMVLLTFAPLAKPTVTKREIPEDFAKEEKRKKKNNQREQIDNNQEQQDVDEEGEIQQQKQHDEKSAPTEGNLFVLQDQTKQDQEAMKEMEELNDLLRHKAKQQFQTTLLRAFVISVPFAYKSWHYVEGALLSIGEQLRAIGVAMVDLRRFHLALVNALKAELGESGFDVEHQSAWVQVSSLIFRKLMGM